MLPRAFRIKWNILTTSLKVLCDLAPEYHWNTASTLPHQAYDDTLVTRDSFLFHNNAHMDPSIGTSHLFLSLDFVSPDLFYQGSCLSFRFQLNWHPLISILIICVFLLSICLSRYNINSLRSNTFSILLVTLMLAPRRIYGT